jgi:hypothetical protein
VWDSTVVDVRSSMSFGHVLVIKGTFIPNAQNFIIFNVYAPCDAAAKKSLWERLIPLVLNNSDVCVCVCGDFNSIRSVEEMKGRGLFLGRQRRTTLIISLLTVLWWICLYVAAYLLGLRVMAFQ